MRDDDRKEKTPDKTNQKEEGELAKGQDSKEYGLDYVHCGSHENGESAGGRGLERVETQGTEEGNQEDATAQPEPTENSSTDAVAQEEFFVVLDHVIFFEELFTEGHVAGSPNP